MRKFRWTVSITLLLSSCATSTPVAPPTSRAQVTRQFCPADARFVRLAEDIVPTSERPLDLALTDEFVWVLYRPARLLRIDRDSRTPTIKMWMGTPGEEWTALALDPSDSSVWIGTRPYGLRHLRPLQGMVKIALRGASGEGGFLSLLVAEAGIYAQPEAAEDGIWHFDRGGKLVAASFPRGPMTEDVLTLEQNNPLRLEQGSRGEVFVWDGATGTLHQAASGHDWTAIDGGPFAGLPAAGTTIGGLNVGGRSERWYFPSAVRSLFYWQGEARFLGSTTVGGIGQDTVLLVPSGTGYREVVEDCRGYGLLAVRADGAGSAALIAPGVVLGSFDDASGIDADRQ